MSSKILFEKIKKLLPKLGAEVVAPNSPPGFAPNPNPVELLAVELPNTKTKMQIDLIIQYYSQTSIYTYHIYCLQGFTVSISIQENRACTSLLIKLRNPIDN